MPAGVSVCWCLGWRGAAAGPRARAVEQPDSSAAAWGEAGQRLPQLPPQESSAGFVAGTAHPGRGKRQQFCPE